MLRGKRNDKDADKVASANTIAVQQDWHDRDFLFSVQLGVAQLSAFLNEFGARAERRSPPSSYYTSIVRGRRLTSRSCRATARCAGCAGGTARC